MFMHGVWVWVFHATVACVDVRGQLGGDCYPLCHVGSGD